MSEIVKDDGQVMLPEFIRRELGIVPGMAVEFISDANGEVTLRKVPDSDAKSRFSSLIGTATAGLTTDEIMAMTRGED